MSEIKLGTAEEVCDLLDMLLATEVIARETEPKSDTPDTQFVAVYATDTGDPVAVCACSVQLACYVGAGLSMIPPRVAAESAENGTFSDEIIGNLHEVFNICVNLTKAFGAGHLSLREVIAPGDPLPEDIKDIVESPSNRVDFEVDVDKYGIGVMSLRGLLKASTPAETAPVAVAETA